MSTYNFINIKVRLDARNVIVDYFSIIVLKCGFYPHFGIG